MTVLTLRALGLGDLLTGIPAIRAIARAFPDHHRVLAAPKYLAPIVDLCGGVDEVLDVRPLAPLHDRIGEVDIAINLHGRGPQSHRALLHLHPKRLVAFAHREVEETREFPHWHPDEHEIDRWCRMLRESGIPAVPDDIELRRPPRDARASGAIVIHAGAASESRRWPVERWTDVCATLRAQGQRVVLTGSAAEFRRCRMIARAAHVPMDDVVAGKTSLAQLASIVASAQAIVCGDTGVAHLASALGTPSVVLFGPTSPKHWGPPAHPQHRVLWRGTLGDPHAPYVDPGLALITVAEVLAELYLLLQMPHAGVKAG